MTGELTVDELRQYTRCSLAWFYEKRRPEAAEVYTIPVASGFIAGETLMGVLVTFLQVNGWLG